MEEFYDNTEDISFTCPITHEFDRKVKAARFFVKCIKGVEVALLKGYLVRWFTLTESNEAIASGLDFSLCWGPTRKWLKRNFGVDMGLCVVEHRQGDKQRRNWHVVQFGNDKIDALALRGYWQDKFKSTVTGLELIRHPLQAVAYVAGYLNDYEKFVKARFSHNWVFPMWFEFSKWYYNMFCEYPPVEYLMKLSLMSPSRRAIDWCFGEFLAGRKVPAVKSGWVKLESGVSDLRSDEMERQLKFDLFG